MPSPDGHFPTTEWTLVSRLRSRDENISRRALNELCSQYHYPLYCYIRRRGLEHHDAQDALHDFLAKLLRNESLLELYEVNGMLRGFLSKSLQRFLANWHRDHAWERAEISREAERELAEAEVRFQRETLADTDTPERVFERKWARALLRQVQERLRERLARRGKEALYEALRPGLLNGGTLDGEHTARAAATLGISEAAVRVAMTRLRDEYRVVLREEVRQTVERDDDVDAEIAHLLDLFQRS